MNILIAGASGFIGQALVKALMAEHHQLTLLGRNIAALNYHTPTNNTLVSWDQLDSLNATAYDAVINLCGHSINDGRWNDIVKEKVLMSRVNTTTTLTNWLLKYQAKPHFYNASAVGIYGNSTSSLPFEEDSLIHDEPQDFLNQVGIAWENALLPAINANIPVTMTRFGVVLERHHGMLAKLKLPFSLGLGSVMGSGTQALSWVHIDDVVNGYLFLLAHPNITGAVNLTSPNPVSQAEFAKTLASALHRPLLFTMPAFVIKLLFGEMGEALILQGQRVVPKRLLEAGYVFHYPTIDSALAHEFSS